MLRQADRTLVVVGLVFLACVPLCTVLAPLDERMLDGSNVWLKPIKFQLSVGIFMLTLALMMPLAGGGFRTSRWGRGTVWIAFVTSAFEIAWITLRAGLGERSHYATDAVFGGFM
jgi:uncharacterized membrane protein (DUF441 family)